MKKILQAVAVSVMTFGFVGGVASAATLNQVYGYDQDCTISDTGVDSENTCDSTVDNEVHVTCVNNIYVVNDNDQSAGSGDGTVDGNNDGGSATTGDAVNENGDTVQIGASCGTPATTPTTTATTPTGGAGSGQVLSAATQQVVAPAGAVHAGAGAGVASNKVAATTGILGSAGLLGLGLTLRKRAFGRN